MPLSKVISKARPNHPSLDFEVLRAEGISHLEHFATELWSDYNAHDPGITILEVLCYAITDLGYRTRMIPVQDLMAMPGLRTNHGFLADEVLPCGPLTAMDYRKLMIDVKGVKNAWILRSGNEIPIYKMGLVFPSLQDDKGKWDYDKLSAFAKKNKLPIEEWINSVTLTAGEKPSSNTPEAIKNAKNKKYFECVDKFLKTFERDPNLNKYQDIIDLFKGKDNVEKEEVKRWFSNSGIGLNLNSDYISKLHGALKKSDPFATALPYPDNLKNYINTFTQEYDGDVNELQNKGYDRGIEASEFKVKDNTDVKNGFDSFLSSNKYVLIDDGQEIKPANIDNFLTTIKYSFIGITADTLIENIAVERSGKLEKLLNTGTDVGIKRGFKEKFDGFAKNNSKIITQREKDLLRSRIDQKGAKEPLSSSVETLWSSLKSDIIFKWSEESEISWANVEEYEFIKGSIGGVQSEYPDFKRFVMEELPIINSIRPHYDNFIKYYNPGDKINNITFHAYKNTIAPIYNISDEVVVQLTNFTTPTSNQICSDFCNSLIEHFCEYGMWGITIDKNKALSTDATPLVLNGLHTILLDLDENIDPDTPNDVNPVLNRVKAVLHANRALCEDFVQFKIVEDRPIGICLQLDLSPDSDEIEIIAEAIRRMQLYLSPAPRFRTFTERIAELKALGENWSAEHIFNGPLLQNGFLLDAELGSDSLRDTYYHSDLLTEIKLSGDGILGVPILKVNPMPEVPATEFQEKTDYKVKGGEYVDGDYKAVIEVDRCNFRVTKGAQSYEVSGIKIAERLELLRLIHDTDPLEPRGGPVWEEGIFRPDLGDYNSIQYEFPNNYSIGDNRLPAHIAPKRRAQAKQLQAYLAIYDQILAAYLQQLGRVRQLLSVDQTLDLPTRVLPLLYDMPGIRDLIGEDAPFDATAVDWTMALGSISDTMVSIPMVNGEQNTQSDYKLVTKATLELRKKTQWKGILELRYALSSALSDVHLHLHENYTAIIEDFFWSKYTNNPNNKYAQMVREMAESPADHQRRRNQLLDHLLARFGESFSTYAATLLRPESEPEDNPLLQDYDSYLSSKAKFLKETAHLSYARNKGYNYKLFNTLQNFSDVWNTENVSGVQRRVSRLLGIDNWSARSLIAEPDFRIDRFKTTSKRGMANYFGALRKRIGYVDTPENPDEAVPLMKIPNHKSPNDIQHIIKELYEIIWQAKYYNLDEIVPDAAQYWFTIVPHKDDYKAVFLKRTDDPKVNLTLLESEVLSLDEAKLRIEVMIDLVQPKQQTKINEGFHIVEHILLRPLEADDALLKLSLGCEPTEVPRDPYSFWITVVAPAETTRFSDLDFRKTFEYTLRSELPAHIAARFSYLDLKALYTFEDQFGRWMFEKAKCNPPNYCRVDDETKKLVEMLNNMPVKCPCDEQEVDFDCNKTLSSSISS